jgi:hypothetical protein
LQKLLRGFYADERSGDNSRMLKFGDNQFGILRTILDDEDAEGRRKVRFTWHGETGRWARTRGLAGESNGGNSERQSAACANSQ